MASGHDDVHFAREWTPSRIRAEVAERTWFHTIDVGHGILTPGHRATDPWYSVPRADEINPTTLVAKLRYRLRHRFGSPRSGRMVFHAYV